MKVIKTASGKKISLSKSEWESIGKTAGWIKNASFTDLPMPLYDDVYDIEGKIMKWVEVYLKNEEPEIYKEKHKQIYQELIAFCQAQMAEMAKA